MFLKTKSMSIKKISFNIVGKGLVWSVIFPYLEVLGIYQIEGYVWTYASKIMKIKKQSRTLNFEVFRWNSQASIHDPPFTPKCKVRIWQLISLS